MAADNKYGELYTEDEVVRIVQIAVDSALEYATNGDEPREIRAMFSDGNIREVARADINRMFLPGEPLFVLRGQDRRAIGAIRWYRDHQFPSARPEHLDSIDEALARFEAYRNLAGTKEPD